ncbi:PE family protein [Mycobacterium haemophilum]|uniref:PE family protein n=1 Tax=Mycobacterium haemophilum TaxID=29311 RepID=UPI0009EA3108|nr:PE family protein [Mycobacterium haemophilum]
MAFMPQSDLPEGSDRLLPPSSLQPRRRPRRLIQQEDSSDEEIESLALVSSRRNKDSNASSLRDKEAMQASPDSMTGISTKMVEIAHQVSIANAQKAPAMTKIPAPGKDSVSALLARFFNARGVSYQVHTDRGADIGEQFSWSLKDAATAYSETDKI